MKTWEAMPWIILETWGSHPLLISLFGGLDFLYEFLNQGGPLCLSACENQDSHLAEAITWTSIFLFLARGIKNYFGKSI